MRFSGTLYRALNPIYARTPLSGEGAKRHGGRFNPKGMFALYTSLAPETAIREANQVGYLQPTTLVALRADIDRVFDGTDETGLAVFGLDAARLGADDWRARVIAHEPVPTQDFARRLVDEGYTALLVPSYARGTTGSDRNLVLWQWGDAPPARIEVVDDEDRLGGPA